MSWQERFYDVLAEMLREEFEVDAVKVTAFKDHTYYGGYCETCSYEEIRCQITYIDSNNCEQEFMYDDSFAGLIDWLDRQTAP